MATSHQDIPRFRPRIGGGRGKVPEQRFPSGRNAILARIRYRFASASRARGSGSLSGPGRRSTIAVRAPGLGAQRCVVKARIVPMTSYGVGAARLHLKYIERDGVEQDGAPGLLYGTADRDALTQVIPEERHQFRFIVSPEDAQGMDLGDFTRELMQKVEKDLGRELVWGAVNHYNTDNPHVHVVVRGIDTDGEQVRIDRSYISHGMRWRAQELLTHELGPRIERDRERHLSREVQMERPTRLDKELVSALGSNGTIDIARLPRNWDIHAPRREHLIGRLQVLGQLGLAERTSPRSWRLADGWQESLRSLGQRAEIMDRMHQALGPSGNSVNFHVVDGTSSMEPVEGIVRRKGLHDELRGDFYAVIETANGHAYYVQLDPTTAKATSEGSVVRLSVRPDTWVKEMDRVIEQVAAQRAGVYDPQSHRESLRLNPPIVAGRPLEPEAVVEANLRRLERLERHQLVTRLQDGTWRVPPDLVASLREREVTHPRLRVGIERVAPSLRDQVQHRGRVWLDSLPANDQSRAPYGFGAEIAEAVRRRAEVLRTLAIDRSSSEGARALGGIERDELGRELAVKAGLTYLSDPPRDFRGRLLACQPTAMGQRFVRIVDDATRRMTLVPASPITLGLECKFVGIELDPGGHVRVRPLGLSRAV